MASPDFSRYGAARVALLTAEEMRAWDRSATEGGGIPERVLMEAAGRTAAAVVDRCFPRGKIVAVMGRGHNGGDGLVLLRSLCAWGRAVGVIYAGKVPEPELLHGWELETVPDAEADGALASAACIVDALLGTGARGAPREPEAGWIRRINRAGPPVVALDGPSGVDMSSGATPGQAVRAAVTVTFGAPKRGLLRFPGRECAGRLIAVDVGFPPLPEHSGARLITPGWAHVHLPRVPPDAHKGTQGTVAVVAGSPGVAGAAAMASMGALRSGAGMVRLVSAPENRAVLQGIVPEALFSARDSDRVEHVLESADAALAGPGMGTGDAERDLLRRVVATGDQPLLLDADALTLLSREPELLEEVHRPVLLTPHPGEMGRLLGRDTSGVVADPFAVAAEAAARWKCAVLLKGAPSLVAAPGEPTRATVTGHSGIATGGMGDTLGGVALAFLGFGCPPAEAAALALFFCGRAAEIAGRGRGLLPRDVAEHLPAALVEGGAQTREPLVPGVILDLPPPR